MIEWAKLAVSAIVPLIAAAVVVVGWQHTHRLSAERDRANKRRELRVAMMLDTYRLLIGLMNRELAFEDLPAVSQAMEGIQLLGTPQQIEIAKEFSRSLAETFAAGEGTFNLDGLLVALRASIRDDLELEKVQDDLFHLKVIAKSAIPSV